MPDALRHLGQVYDWRRSAFMKVQCVVLAFAGPLLAQPPANFSVDVNLVRVPCIVTRANGAPVQDLRKEDFIVLEDGKPREVKYLWRETDLPLTVVVAADVSCAHFQSPNLQASQEQYTQDILQVLRQVFSANDRMAIVGVSDQARLVTDLTGSLEELRSGAAVVRRRVELPILGDPCAGRNPALDREPGAPCGFSVLWDGVFSSARLILLPQNGRKAMLLLTGGLDTGSDHGLKDAIAECQRAGAMVYSIRDADHYAWVPEPAPETGPITAVTTPLGIQLSKPQSYNYLREKSDLDRISRETGGVAFDRRDTPLEEVLDRIQADLRSQYVLGFEPASAHSPRKLHKLQVKVTLPDLKVRAQDRYYTH